MNSGYSMGLNVQNFSYYCLDKNSTVFFNSSNSVVKWSILFSNDLIDALNRTLICSSVAKTAV